MLSYVPGTTKVHSVDELLKQRTELLKKLHANLTVARSRMKTQADQGRREVTFEVGEYVLLKLQPYRQQTVSYRSSHKLSPRYYGPFRILQKLGPVAYRLQLPAESQIHDVFHVSLLRRYEGPITGETPLQPVPAPDEPLISRPEAILATRVIQKGRYRPKTEVLIKWIGASEVDATWENKWRLAKRFPDFFLADKEIPRGED